MTKNINTYKPQCSVQTDVSDVRHQTRLASRKLIKRNRKSVILIKLNIYPQFRMVFKIPHVAVSFCFGCHFVDFVQEKEKVRLLV